MEHYVTKDIFVDLEPNFICGICNDVLKKPVDLGACSHACCAECVSSRTDTKCPTCKAPYIKDSVLRRPNKWLVRALWSKTVKCPKNCLEEMQLGDNGQNLSDHLALSCSNSVVSCTACKESVRRGDLHKHDVQSCWFREVTCRECGAVLPFAGMVEHKSNALGCANIMLCANGCITPTGELCRILVAEEESHRRLCPLERIPCPVCGAFCARRDMEVHERDSAVIHMRRLAVELRVSQADTCKLREELGEERKNSGKQRQELMYLHSALKALQTAMVAVKPDFSPEIMNIPILNNSQQQQDQDQDDASSQQQQQQQLVLPLQHNDVQLSDMTNSINRVGRVNTPSKSTGNLSTVRIGMPSPKSPAMLCASPSSAFSILSPNRCSPFSQGGNNNNNLNSNLNTVSSDGGPFPRKFQWVLDIPSPHNHGGASGAEEKNDVMMKALQSLDIVSPTALLPALSCCFVIRVREAQGKLALHVVFELPPDSKGFLIPFQVGLRQLKQGCSKTTAVKFSQEALLKLQTSTNPSTPSSSTSGKMKHVAIGTSLALLQSIAQSGVVQPVTEPNNSGSPAWRMVPFVIFEDYQHLVAKPGSS